MKVLLTSDTHYGFDEKTYKILNDFLVKVQEEKPDVILHAGDWAATSQEHLEKGVKVFRQFFPEIPIIGTAGNHDYWRGGSRHNHLKSIDAVAENVQRMFKKYNILSRYEKDDFIFASYDSWYKSTSPMSNDAKWMPSVRPRNTHEYMKQKYADPSFEKLREDVFAATDKKWIIVTHFSPFPYRQDLADYFSEDFRMEGDMSELDRLVALKAHTICYGHTHQHQKHEIGDEHITKIFNCGADYNKPAYIVFEV